MKYTLIAGLAALWASSLQAATVDASYKIFIPEIDSKLLMSVTLEQTADALKKGIREATGLELKVVRSDAATGKGFYLGDGFARRDGFSTEGLKDWANVYRVKDGSVYLYGARDWTTRPEQKWVWQNGVQPTIRATIRFMEDALGARFMMPGWVGTEVPKRASIELKEGTVSTETPRLDFGAGCNCDMLHAYANECFGCGRYHSYGGHLYLPACPYDKYAKTHPEYFGVTKDGRYMCQVPAWRGWEPLCITNPDVEQLIIDELCRKFDAGSDVCELGQSDALLYCECENCLNYAGLRDDPGPHHGEQRWVFHRHIAERMMKERPGKIVHIISYGATENPPRTFHDFPSNVMVELCRYSEENLKRWKDWGTVPHGFTVYTYLWGEYHKVGLTPKHSMAFLAHEAHRFLEAGIHGIYRCGYGEFWGLEGYAYYVFNRTLRHPEAKAEDLFSEYVNAMFGLAAKPMRAFYETIDARLAIREAAQARQKASDADAALQFVAERPQSNIETIADSWDKATLGKLEGLLAAAQATDGLSEKQVLRLRFVAAEFTYLRTIANVCHTYLAFQAGASEETAKAAAAAVVRHRKFLDRVYGADGYPKPVPNWRHVALFGGNPRHILDRNGRNVGRIEEPLNWNVEKIVSDYDVSGWQAKDKANRKLKRLTGWKLDSGFKAAKFENTPDGFHIETDETNWNARVVAKYRDLVDLKPGKKCRLSWYVKIPWQKPSVKTKWDGEASMRVWYGTGPKEDVAAPLVSYKLPSTDWVHQSLDFTLTGDPKTSTEVAFRLYYRLGDFWMKDITIEEIEE